MYVGGNGWICFFACVGNGSRKESAPPLQPLPTCEVVFYGALFGRNCPKPFVPLCVPPLACRSGRSCCSLQVLFYFDVISMRVSLDSDLQRLVVALRRQIRLGSKHALYIIEF
jgi:hypothetical protein